MITPPPPYPPSGHAPERGLAVRILITIAVIWLTLTGGCTLVFSGVYIASGDQTYGLAFLVPILIVGLVCMLPGILCLIIGLALRNRTKRRPTNPATFD